MMNCPGFYFLSTCFEPDTPVETSKLAEELLEFCDLHNKTKTNKARITRLDDL